MTTTERPMTDAERRALDALVEWRRAHAIYTRLPYRSREQDDAMDAENDAEAAMKIAADALAAEREVRRG